MAEKKELVVSLRDLVSRSAVAAAIVEPNSMLALYGYINELWTNRDSMVHIGLYVKELQTADSAKDKFAVTGRALYVRNVASGEMMATWADVYVRGELLVVEKGPYNKHRKGHLVLFLERDS